jgi:hypothetical protein
MLDKKFDEAGRLAALRQYNIMDTAFEEDYDSISYLAAVMCGVPIAFVTFLDEKRNWFKSRYGSTETESPRETSFCQHAVAQGEPVMIVENAREDDRFKKNPYVAKDPNIVFYAGAPLVTKEGYSIGTVCVLDTAEKKLTAEQIKGLEILSQRAMEMLELRRNNAELQILRATLESKNSDLEQFAMIVSHDIKSPLTSIILANEMLQMSEEITSNEENMKFINLSNKAANKIRDLVDGILSFAKSEHDLLQRSSIGTRKMIEGLFDSVSFPKEVKMIYDGEDNCFEFNTIQAEQIFLNLINNAVRYNDKIVATVSVKCEDDGDMTKFTVTDNGNGIEEDRLESIFDLFVSSKSPDSFGVKGTGIGLATVKKIVENSNGTISVSSKLGVGSTFIIRLPKEYKA